MSPSDKEQGEFATHTKKKEEESSIMSDLQQLLDFYCLINAVYHIF